MWWFVFQSLIVFAVMASNVHWQWTSNGYLAGLIGIVLAYGVTVGLTGLWRLVQGRLRGG